MGVMANCAPPLPPLPAAQAMFTLSHLSLLSQGSTLATQCLSRAPTEALNICTDTADS